MTNHDNGENNKNGPNNVFKLVPREASTQNTHEPHKPKKSPKYKDPEITSLQNWKEEKAPNILVVEQKTIDFLKKFLDNSEIYKENILNKSDNILREQMYLFGLVDKWWHLSSDVVFLLKKLGTHIEQHLADEKDAQQMSNGNLDVQKKYFVIFVEHSVQDTKTLLKTLETKNNRFKLNDKEERDIVDERLQSIIYKLKEEYFA
jgi:hypothetical protein